MISLKLFEGRYASKVRIASWQYPILFCLILFGSLWIGYLAYFSPLGTIVQYEVGHIIISQRAWSQPGLLLDTWGRCVNTLFYMLPALYSLYAARAFAVIAVAVMVVLYARIAHLIAIPCWWFLPLFLYTQPWFSDFAYATTAVPFAVLLGLAAYAMLTERHIVAGICMGLLPLVRHEGILLLMLWMSYALWQRHLRASIFACLPMVVYNFICFLALGSAPVLLFFEPKPTELYGSGGWLHFAPDLYTGIGWPILLLALVGLPTLLMRRSFIIVALPAGVYLLGHVVIYRYGLFASGGYSYFLLPIAFIVGLAAIQGCMLLLHARTSLYNRFVLKSIAGLLVLASMWLAGQNRPLAPDPEAVATKQAAEWIQHTYSDSMPIIAHHVWFYYFEELPLMGPNKLWWFAPPANSINYPALMVWDSHYSDGWGWSRDYLDDPRNGWRLINRFDAYVAVYQKQ